MGRLNAREERELVHLAQSAQSGILRLLQLPESSLESQSNSLGDAVKFLQRLETLSTEIRHISKKSVPNDKIRTLLEKALISDPESSASVLVPKEQLLQAKQVVNQLREGRRPSESDLVDCLHFIRDTITTKIIMSSPPSPLRVTA